MANFQTRLKEARKDFGLTQFQLATMIGVDESFISLMEHGKREPSLWTFKQLVNVLGVSADDLLGID